MIKNIKKEQENKENKISTEEESKKREKIMIRLQH